MFDQIQVLWQLWDWFQSPTATAIFVALFGLSEALGGIPQIRANGVFHAIYLALAKLAKKDPAPLGVVLALLTLAGCSHWSGDVSKVKQTIVVATSDAKKVVVWGCEGLPAMEVVANAVLTVVDATALPIAALDEARANAVCTAVLKAQLAGQAKPVAPALSATTGQALP